MNRSSVAVSHNAVYDVDRVRRDFPILGRTVHGRPLVYLDNGASTQKPQSVIDTMTDIYTHHYANVHRGVHALSQEASEAYEKVRATVAQFLGVEDDNTIVFTHGATEAFNLIANTWGRKHLRAGDEIILSHMEHHANIVPWQLLQQQQGFTIRVAPIHDDGSFDREGFVALLNEKTKLVGITHVSNTLGTVVPVKEVARLAHDAGAVVLVDGCQSAPHQPVNLADMDVDFFVISPHKLYGPSGVGAFYGRADILADMPPWQGGGDMISSVSFDGSCFQKPPLRFEAGTPPIVDVIGMGAALEYLETLGMEAIHAHEQALLQYATKQLLAVSGVRLIGTAPHKAAILSFVLGDIHAHDIGTIVDRAGVAVRVGHHCAQPVMERFDVPATVRASFGLYNTFEEVDAFVQSIEMAKELFG